MMKNKKILVLVVFSCLTFSCMASESMAFKNQSRGSNRTVERENPSPSVMDVVFQAYMCYRSLPDIEKKLIKSIALMGLSIVALQTFDDRSIEELSRLELGVKFFTLTNLFATASMIVTDF